ncbi:AsnC family transcriptional regulator [Defluviimonas aestuarii]|uniref:siroheme decarboxylase subunit beta n=1 Tax=Albidovulum aestuarii TaxID=1130726 RepID=UPI002499B7E0|nr:AsnC family transcriptional regulator [Defluviimonas aestuarii]MDI3337611.1 AsnC family transcriptional regulator [Defluviimonas aestuarii]
MLDRLDPIDRRLLDDFQRDLPLVPRPFAAMGEVLGVDEAEVLQRLDILHARGMVSRVGATVRPNTAGASTLAAMAVPSDRIEEIAEIVGAEPGVNHSYLREDAWNLWFVATAPDATALEAALGRIGSRTGLRVLDLRLVRPFNIDLGFRLAPGARQEMSESRAVNTDVLEQSDRPILQALTAGLPLTLRPFRAVAQSLSRNECDIIARIAALSDAGLLTRVGVIVRHRAIGWSANAMVVWNLPEDRIDAAGPALARQRGVTLCYRRLTVPGIWDYPLYSMIHARSRSEALSILAEAAALPELAGAAHRVLFSTRCFKQTGALLKAEAA